MSESVDRRNFMGVLGTGAVTLAAGAASAQDREPGWWREPVAGPGEHKLPDLRFGYDGLVLNDGDLKGISPQTVEWHHGRHHAGYVKALNNIEKSIAGMDGVTSDENAPTFGDLKRRESFNASGMILHNLYWDRLSPGGQAARESMPVVRKLASDFGSFERWSNEFITCGKTASIGWAVLALSPEDRRLHNYVCSLHELGAVWGAVPLLALDVWEHAYYHDYGPDRAAYIRNWMRLVNWETVSEAFVTAARSM